ncbi:MAG: tetratricopeptide repeat protein [Candidatus Sericytochromatia bacterium]
MLSRLCLAATLILGLSAFPAAAETEVFSVKQLLLQSGQAMAQGDYTQALELLNQALDIEPSYPEIYFRRATVAFLQRDLAQAELDLNRAIELAPSAYEPRLLRSQVYYFRKAYAQAETDARWLVERFPTQWRSYRELAQALQALGKNQAALDVLQKAPDSVKREPELFLLQAEILGELSRDKEAQALLDEVIRQDADLLEAYELRAALYLRSKAYQAALETYRELGKRTGHPLYQLEISRMQAYMQQNAQALETFEKTLQAVAQPDVDFLIKAGYVALDLQKPLQAAGFFARAAQATKNPALTYMQAFSLQEGGLYAEARDLLSAKIRQNQITIDDYVLLSWVNLLLKEPGDAEQAARRGLELQPDEGNLTLNLAHALWLQGQTEEALALYRRMQQSQRADGSSWNQAIQADFATLRKLGLKLPELTP